MSLSRQNALLNRLWIACLVAIAGTVVAVLCFLLL